MAADVLLPQSSRVKDKTWTLIASSLSVIVITITSTGLNVALPAIHAEFGADAIVLSWMVTAFVLASAVCALPAGRIADIVGLKKIFLLGIVLFTITSAAAAFSTSSTMLIICRTIQGISGGMIAVSSFAIVTATHPLAERGRALGINIACVYAGSSMGPFLGGILTEHLGWRSVFAINIPLGLAVIALLIWKVQGEWRSAQHERFDYAGSLVYALALVAVIYGLSVLPEVLGGVLILAGGLGLVAFFKLESRSTSPVLNTTVFRDNRPFVFSNAAALISYSIIFAVPFLLSLYLQDVKGFSPEIAGLVLAAQPVMQTLISPLTGRLSDKVEPRLLASAGMGLILAGLTFFAFINESTPVAEIVGALLVLGLGFGLFSPPNTNAIMSSVTPKFLGVASAVMSTMRSVGQMLSMGITMVVISIVVGRVAIAPQNFVDFLNSTRTTFGIFAALCILGIFASLSRGRVH